MSNNTKIEWCDATWNPIGGCRRKASGCLNCFAERTAYRLGHNPNTKIKALYSGLTQITNGRPGWTGEVGFSESALLEPLKRQTPTKYFISLSDLFYDNRPDDHIDRVFAVMALCPQHEFVVLTKYVERAEKWFGDPNVFQRIAESWRGNGMSDQWPLPNLTLGVSISTQAEADALIPVLLRIPAARRIVSAEPLIEAVDLRAYMEGGIECPSCGWCGHEKQAKWITCDDDDRYDCPKCGETCAHRPLDELLDGIIVGGESGPGARPCDVTWIRSIVRQCADAGTPCFVKQFGAAAFSNEDRITYPGRKGGPQGFSRYLNDKKGGDMAEWPEDLRVREWPEVTR